MPANSSEAGGPRARKIPDKTWDDNRAEIERLYVQEKRSLEGGEGVMSTMARLHSFYARHVIENLFPQKFFMI